MRGGLEPLIMPAAIPANADVSFDAYLECSDFDDHEAIDSYDGHSKRAPSPQRRRLG